MDLGARFHDVAQERRNQGRPTRPFRMSFDSRLRSDDEGRMVPQQRSIEIGIAFHRDQQFRFRRVGHHVRLSGRCWNVHLSSGQRSRTGRHLLSAQRPHQEIHRPRDSESDGPQSDSIFGRPFSQRTGSRHGRMHHSGRSWNIVFQSIVK